MSENENISTHVIGEGLIGGITQETTTTEKIDPTKTIKKITYNETSIPLYNSGLTWYSPVTDGSPSVSLAVSSKTKSFQIPISAAPAVGDIILIMSTSSSVICFYYSINKKWVTENTELTFSSSPIYSNHKLNFTCSYSLMPVPSKACFITNPNK